VKNSAYRIGLAAVALLVGVRTILQAQEVPSAPTIELEPYVVGEARPPVQPGDQAVEMTLQDAIDRALENNLGIRSARLNPLIQDYALDVARATRNRPLPSGRLTGRDALSFALAIGLLGLGILALAVNALTAVLTFFSLIGYAVIYTVYLKRATPQNIVIGGAAGAAPPMLGWAAVQNEVSGYALLLVLIIFTWTPPHFWALAIARKADYEKAEIPMLPVTHGEQVTKSFVLYYTILLLIVTLLPYLTGMAGVLYLLAALLLGGGFLHYALLLKFRANEGTAMQTFAFSITYLIALFTFLLLDHYVPAVWPE
jgi:protoheme IX farnesyltransferase